MLGRTRRIHFTGIGGTGMSGIAEVLLNMGFTVTGSDIRRTTVTRRLQSLGARVRLGHQAVNVCKADVVVMSSAIASTNPEVRAARKARLGFGRQKRPVPAHSLRHSG